MKLTYLEEMVFTEHFLKTFRLRLTDKALEVLPKEGVRYDGVEPSTRSLLGSIGPLPDPNYDGPQPPSAMGMVLLVVPDQNGIVRCQINGQFDVVHQYIPDLEMMRKNLIREHDGLLKKQQQIAPCYKRYTIEFNDVNLDLSVAKAGVWVRDDVVLPQVLDEWRQRWLNDPRVFRRRVLTDRGNPRFYFDWHDDAMDSQDAFEQMVYKQLFEDAEQVLPYRARLRGRLRPAPLSFTGVKNAFLAELYLENDLTAEVAKPFGIYSPYLLDAKFITKIVAGFQHKVPHRLKPEDYRYIDEDGLPGYGVTCSILEISGDTFSTDTFPTAAQPKIEAPLPKEVGMPIAPSYKQLQKDPFPVLDSLLISLQAYNTSWEARIASLDPNSQFDEIAAVKADQKSFEDEVLRIKDGIALLRKNSSLLQCFQWMNESMDCAIRMQAKSFDGWHLFQLGFILTQVRSIFERHAPESECQKSAEVADVLWFATGGGKTEAYLGIITMAMFYCRKMQRTYGTTAWMRFPLRMLSVQQFQRLSFVVAQANIIRQREKLNGHPFSIGYFTGGGTPSRISTNSEFYQKDFLPNLSDHQMKAYQFISDCPYCGTARSIELQRDYAQARLKHVCKNSSCWSNVDSEPGKYGEGIRGEIGIYVSDEECYRYLPTVMVGTIDKLAVIGHNVRFSAFFGVAKHFCPHHGFCFDAKCSHYRISETSEGYESKPCGNNSRTSSVRTISLPRMLDPGFSLLIQDELHLLKESLGNFDAHYETLLSAIQVAHNGQTPKVLAATATIKDFEDHIHHLYLKNAKRFPAPGAKRGESFYARRVRSKEHEIPLVRRWFAAVLPIGKGSAVSRAVAEISTRFLEQVDEWRERLKSREPSLLKSLSFDEPKSQQALAYINRYLNTDLIYANRKRNIPEVLRFMEEANKIPGKVIQHFQLDGESTLDEILSAIHHIERKEADDPRRHIIATSIVSHGVDITELNFMVLAGWPPSTAEYIQASARSGRVHPGIIISVLSSTKLYETNVFLNFQDYQYFIDRLVESVPINRFAPNLLDRTLPGVIAAVLLNWAPQTNWGQNLDRNIKSLFTVLTTTGSPAREEILSVVMSALEIPTEVSNCFDTRILSEFRISVEAKVRHALHRLEHWNAGKMDQSITEALGDIFGHEPLKSFRDIENQILVKPVSEDAEKVLDALAR